MMFMCLIIRHIQILGRYLNRHNVRFQLIRTRALHRSTRITVRHIRNNMRLGRPLFSHSTRITSMLLHLVPNMNSTLRTILILRAFSPFRYDLLIGLLRVILIFLRQMRTLALLLVRLILLAMLFLFPIPSLVIRRVTSRFVATFFLLLTMRIELVPVKIFTFIFPLPIVAIKYGSSPTFILMIPSIRRIFVTRTVSTIFRPNSFRSPTFRSSSVRPSYLRQILARVQERVQFQPMPSHSTPVLSIMAFRTIALRMASTVLRRSIALRMPSTIVTLSPPKSRRRYYRARIPSPPTTKTIPSVLTDTWFKIRRTHPAEQGRPPTISIAAHIT